MSHRNMKEELTCPICMELFRQPRRLPCGHSYCYICLKAMLDRCTESTRLYPGYSRSLVCPECREEVNIESDRGVEMIPPDFKLSKLVDLFKFMKTNDSSDSSSDEVQPHKPGFPADTSAAAAAEVRSLPVTAASTGASSSHNNHVLADQSAVSTVSQGQSTSTHLVVASSGGVTPPAVVSSPAVSAHPNVASNSQATASSSSPADTHNIQSGTFHARESSLCNLPPSHVTCNVVSPGSSHSQVSAVDSGLARVGGSSERPSAGNHSGLILQSRNSTEDFGSVSELGIDGGVQSVADSGLPVRSEQQVDSLEILSNWVNENHFYSQGSRNQSHSVVSLPAEVVLEAAESCPENLPGLTCHVGRGTRAQSVPTETAEWNRSTQPGGSREHVASKNLRPTKARKVKRGVFSRFVDSDTSSDSSNNGRDDHRSAGRPKGWLMTRFLRSVILSDSSTSDYSDDDDDVERDTRSSATERKTFQLQRNHLSTDSQQSHPQTVTVVTDSSQGVHHRRISESSQSTGSNTDHKVVLGCQSSPGKQSQATTQQNNSATPEMNRNMVSSTHATDSCSFVHNTSTKELSQVGDTVSSADTLPQVTHSWKSSQGGAAVSSSTTTSQGRGSYLAERRSQSCDTPTQVPQRVGNSRRKHSQERHRAHQLIPGSPPNFYDNLSPPSDGEEGRTLYDNVARERASFGAEGSEVGLVRNLFNPCNQQQSLELPSENDQGRTFYDNMESHNRTDHISTKPNHSHHRERNPVTDIDDLKTGYEHPHVENVNIIQAETEEPNARHPEEPTHLQHMGELDHDTRCLSMPSPAEHLTEAGGNCNSCSSSDAQKHFVNAGQVLDSGDHHSFYDNINNSHSLGHSHGAAALNQRVSDSALGSLSEDSNTRLAYSEEHSSDSHLDSFNTQGKNGVEELQCMDNYLDHYSQQFRHATSVNTTAASTNKMAASTNKMAASTNKMAASTNKMAASTNKMAASTNKTAASTNKMAASANKSTASANRSAAFAKTAAAANKSASSANPAASAKTDASPGVADRSTNQKTRVGDTTHASAEPALFSTAGCGSQVGGVSSSQGRNAEGGGVQHDDVDSENGSTSGTSTLQNKKKPRSRIKKFLTSLLSLSSSSSSSSDDEVHQEEASSESSGW